MMSELMEAPRRLDVPSDGPPRRLRISKEARLCVEQRGQDLLIQWLSPRQARQYRASKSFEVVGSDTGKLYRIHRGAAMNVEELTDAGRVARRWCFAPEGASAAGDVMLAQKIALEKFELDALSIANNDGSREVHDAGFLQNVVLAVRSLLMFASIVTLLWSLSFYLKIIF
jgi:hypothetical protein